MKIYVAGPYTASSQEEREENVRKALDIGIELMGKGHYPFIPHLSHYTEMRANETGTNKFNYEHWMDQDEAFLRDCDALFFIDSSNGADQELKVACDLGMPVYTKIADIPEATELEKNYFRDTSGHPRFKALLDEAWKLHKFKSKKYGSKEDPLANLHAEGISLRTRPYHKALDELSNIMVRMKNLIRAAEAEKDLSLIDEEPLRNVFMDLGAYSYLALILLEEEGIC